MNEPLEKVVAAAGAVVLLLGVGWTILRPAGQYQVTAYFDAAVGLYEGSDVRVLGIPVGEVTQITAMGDQVRAELLLDDEYAIPATANAVVLAPSLVSDRYVQLSPVYSSGKKMEHGGEIPQERTATPVELDRVYSALDELSVTLGPTGANRNGALSDLIDVGARNLEGNGENLNDTLTQFSRAVQTLSESREDLFSSFENLQRFTTALAQIDASVGQFNENMAAVTELLAAEREDLAAAVTLLNDALRDVSGFIRTNRDLLTTNIDRLSEVTLTLVQQRNALATVMEVAPAALGNLARAYNPQYGTLDTRDNGVGSTNQEVVVCGALHQLGRIQPDDLPVQVPTPGIPVALPTTIDGICARLLSGDADANGSPDDLNGNGTPDYEELRAALQAALDQSGSGIQLPGLPPIPGAPS